ncbi:MAG: N-acyl homoserine lactonase family protein [Pseudomonadota bacterium]
MSNADTYEVYAIRYGTVQDRPRHTNFIVADPHEGNMPIDYFVWALVNKERTIVIDTGFDHKEAASRGREIIRLPSEGLAMIGVDAAKVKDVVITHLHYDHAGTCGDFPDATFHLQEKEMFYATGRHMTQDPFSHPYTCCHAQEMVGYVFDRRVAFHDGDEEIAPGVSVHLIGGHSMGIQSVRVKTERGWLVVASDAAHFYENMETDSPFPIVYNVADMIDGFGKLRRLAQTPKDVVPGHDPLVLERYPAPNADLKGIVARLDKGRIRD